MSSFNCIFQTLCYKTYLFRSFAVCTVHFYQYLLSKEHILALTPYYFSRILIAIFIKAKKDMFPQCVFKSLAIKWNFLCVASQHLSLNIRLSVLSLANTSRHNFPLGQGWLWKRVNISLYLDSLLNHFMEKVEVDTLSNLLRLSTHQQFISGLGEISTFSCSSLCLISIIFSQISFQMIYLYALLSVLMFIHK